MANTSVKSFCEYFDKVPAELLLEIVSNFEDAEDLINFAMSHPDRFLCSSFNIFVQDAAKQIAAEAAQAQPRRPLLYTAIEDGHNLETIRLIAQAYRETHQESINGIWGSNPSTLPPPLHFAVEAGRTDLVPMLLDLGADPHIRYSKGRTNSVAGNCDQAGFVHRQCTIAGVGVFREMSCYDAVGAAIYAAFYLNPRDAAMHDPRNPAMHRAIEDCALELLRLGATIQPFPGSTIILTAAYAGMGRLIKAVFGPLAARDDTDYEKRDFKQVSSGFLRSISVLPGKDGREDIIEYMGTLEGPTGYLVQIDDPLPVSRPFAPHLVRETLDHNRPRNAAALLKAFLRRGVFTNPSMLESCIYNDENLSFTKVFYQKLGDGSFDAFADVSPSIIQKSLIEASGLRRRAPETYNWLVSQRNSS